MPGEKTMSGRLEVEKRRFRVPELEALYTEHPRPAGFAYKPELSQEEVEALLVEAESYLDVAPPKEGRMFLFTAESYETMSRRRIEALKATIEVKKPEWVERIKDAARASNYVYTMVSLSGVPPYPAVAIIENLIERGELVEDVY